MTEDPKINVYRENFAPPGSGRPPIADVSKLAYAATSNPGKWVSQVMYNREANSAVGQLKRRGFTVSSAQVNQDQREVFAMYGERVDD